MSIPRAEKSRNELASTERATERKLLNLEKPVTRIDCLNRLVCTRELACTACCCCWRVPLLMLLSLAIFVCVDGCYLLAHVWNARAVCSVASFVICIVCSMPCMWKGTSNNKMIIHLCIDGRWWGAAAAAQQNMNDVCVKCDRCYSGAADEAKGWAGE